MIRSVAYISSGSCVTITMADGAVWFDDASLPADTDIRRQLAEWIAAGNAIAPFVAPVVAAPSVVSAFQAKAALLNAGLYDRSLAAAQSAGGLTWLAWQTATEFQRSSPAIAFLAASLGLTEAQVDDLFRNAAAITA